MIMIGMTISLAGKPRMKDNSITPSSPISFANGSIAFEHMISRLASPYFMLAKSEMIIPAGMATATALPSTKRVLSKIERIIIWPMCGFRNGGNSIVNEDGKPFSMVSESSFDAAKDRNIENRISNVSRKTPVIDPIRDMDEKNMAITAMIVGNRPLHGIKLFVNIAIRRSRGLSIIRHPVTAAALHPKPIHMGCKNLYTDFTTLLLGYKCQTSNSQCRSRLVILYHVY